MTRYYYQNNIKCHFHEATSSVIPTQSGLYDLTIQFYRFLIKSGMTIG